MKKCLGQKSCVFTLFSNNSKITYSEQFFDVLLPMPSRYVSNIDKIIDEAPSDPTQDFKTQV